MIKGEARGGEEPESKKDLRFLRLGSVSFHRSRPLVNHKVPERQAHMQFFYLLKLEFGNVALNSLFGTNFQAYLYILLMKR